jgi:hypothetical protein
VLTHTNPRPPPGAGVAVAVLPVAGAAEGDALTELLGLNKSPSLNLGEAVGLAVGVGVAAGVGVASVCAFLRGPLALADAAGDSAIAGEAGVSAGDAVASAILCWRCFFAGEGDSAGNSDGTATT